MVLKNKQIVKTLQHAVNQCKQRYGDTISHEDVRHISSMISQGDSTLIRKCDDIKSVHYVMYQQKRYKVGYSDELKLVTTFLPVPLGRKLKDIATIKRWKKSQKS